MVRSRRRGLRLGDHLDGVDLVVAEDEERTVAVAEGGEEVVAAMVVDGIDLVRVARPVPARVPHRATALSQWAVYPPTTT